MDILGSSLSNLRYKNLESLNKAEQETLEKEFSSLMWNEVLKSLEQCDEVLQSDLSRSSQSQLNSLRYQMLAQKMGDQYPLDFSSVFKNQEAGSQNLNALPVNRVLPLSLQSKDEISDTETPDSLLRSSHPISFKSPSEFINALLPDIEALNPDEEAIPSEAVLAQAALETGWGKKILGHLEKNPSFNLFNIKAIPSNWSGNKIVKNAVEVIDGQVENIKSSFRSYGSYTESIKDYFNFIRQGRYSDITINKNSPKGFIEKIAGKGYATDPQYAEKINRIVDKIRQYKEKGIEL